MNKSKALSHALKRSKIPDCSAGPMSRAQEDRRILAAEIERLRVSLENIVAADFSRSGTKGWVQWYAEKALRKEAVEAKKAIVGENQDELQRLQRLMAELRKELADAKRALPMERAYLDVIDRHRNTPDGFLSVAAYTDGREVVVLGDPPDEEIDPSGDLHDCDVMGCSSVAHVLLRVRHPEAANS